MLPSLRASDYALCPQTASACRRGTADAVLLVRLEEFTSTAKNTRREIEFLNAIAQSEIVRLIPDFFQSLNLHISHRMAFQGSLIVVKVDLVIVQKCKAGAYVSIPADCKRSLLDERTPVVSFSETGSRDFQRMIPTQSSEDCFTGRRISILGKSRERNKGVDV